MEVQYDLCSEIDSVPVSESVNGRKISYVNNRNQKSCCSNLKMMAKWQPKSCKKIVEPNKSQKECLENMGHWI